MEILNAVTLMRKENFPRSRSVRLFRSLSLPPAETAPDLFPPCGDTSGSGRSAKPPAALYLDRLFQDFVLWASQTAADDFLGELIRGDRRLD